jgi:hypothetical protein
MKIFLVVGVPGSGKTWVCEQLTNLFEYLPHDEYTDGTYIEEILEAAETAEKPILTEAPFSIKQTKEPLEEAGEEVECVFIIENDRIVSERYFEREGREIPRGHLSRQETYRQRAEEYGSFIGTSDEVLEYLRGQFNSLPE